MTSALGFIEKRLAERKINGLYRELRKDNDLIDFSSNDYLGFARSVELKSEVENELKNSSLYKNGSSGSRLLTGNSDYIENTERFIASLHSSEAGLMFNSGYDANLGLFSSVPQRGDAVILDELAHASIIDGTRLSFANRFSFKHNDLESLESRLKQAKGTCYVGIESVYSMDGDLAPLEDISQLTEKYSANLIVDEAHAVGLFGFGLTDNTVKEKIFARVVTFGKALGCHGAIVLGCTSLRNFLINYARSFIYTTAAPPHQVASVKMAYERLQRSDAEIEKLKENIRLFKQHVHYRDQYKLINSDSAIQCLLLNNNEKAKNAALQLQTVGLDVRAILSPTVPENSERIRICLHSFNTQEEILLLTDTINKITDAE